MVGRRHRPLHLRRRGIQVRKMCPVPRPFPDSSAPRSAPRWKAIAIFAHGELLRRHWGNVLRDDGPIEDMSVRRLLFPPVIGVLGVTVDFRCMSARASPMVSGCVRPNASCRIRNYSQINVRLLWVVSAHSAHPCCRDLLPARNEWLYAFKQAYT